MPRTRIHQNNFTAGYLDPLVRDRVDNDLYKAGLRDVDGFLITPQGPVTRAPGTRHVATAPNTSATRLFPFIFSQMDAVVIEAGQGYFRFYRNSAIVLSGGSPYSVSTPYSAADLPDLHAAQSGDVLTLTHPNHPPYELLRFGTTNWVLRLVAAEPPPTEEKGILVAQTLTLSANTLFGTATLTVGAAAFVRADVGRQVIQERTIGVGTATITGYTSTTVVTALVTSLFSSTSLSASQWRIAGSPQAILHIDEAEPLTVGAYFRFDALLAQDEATELVDDGDFPDLTNWTDLSGPLVTSGTADAGSGDELLVDSGATFLTSTVRIGHRVLNTSAAGEDRIVDIHGEGELATTKDGASFAAGNTYEVYKTGVASADGSSGFANLDGGAQGIAWIEQQLTTTAGVTYRLRFNVANAPISAMVGSAATLSDLVAEASYEAGNDHEIIFTATTTTSTIAFRNNQNAVGSVGFVRCAKYSVAAFRVAEIGNHIRYNTGILLVVGIDSSGEWGTAVVRKSPSDTLDALPGAWSIEESQWSADKGWPRTLTYNNGRRVFFSSASFPLRLWGSRVRIHNDYGTGTAADDPYQFDLAATQVNPGAWLVGERALIAGTQREEFTIRGELGHNVTPTSIDVSSPTAYGSINIQPVRTQSAIFFVHRSTKRLYENQGIEDFSGDDRNVFDRSLPAQDLTEDGIISIAYQQEPRPMVWTVTTDGNLRALGYLREHVVAGWVKRTTNGTVKSVAVIPHPDGDRDQVWILVTRNGTVRIEYMEDGAGTFGQAMTDAAVIQTVAAAATTVTGLSHLNGLSVTILENGVRFPSQVVTSGAIARTATSSNVLSEVGLSFVPTLTTLRPAFDRNRTAITGLRLSLGRITIGLLDTLNLIVNGSRIPFESTDTLLDTGQPLFSGLKEVSPLGWDEDAAVVIVQDEPYPVTITSIAATLEVEEP